MRHLVTNWIKVPRYLVELGLWVEQVVWRTNTSGSQDVTGHKPPGILTALIAAKRLFSHHQEDSVREGRL